MPVQTISCFCNSRSACARSVLRSACSFFLQHRLPSTKHAARSLCIRVAGSSLLRGVALGNVVRCCRSRFGGALFLVAPRGAYTCGGGWLTQPLCSENMQRTLHRANVSKHRCRAILSTRRSIAVVKNNTKSCLYSHAR